jgi:hypothetical protein
MSQRSKHNTTVIHSKANGERAILGTRGDEQSARHDQGNRKGHEDVRRRAGATSFQERKSVYERDKTWRTHEKKWEWDKKEVRFEGGSGNQPVNPTERVHLFFGDNSEATTHEAKDKRVDGKGGRENEVHVSKDSVAQYRGLTERATALLGRKKVNNRG